EDGIRYFHVTGVQTCALPISKVYRTNARNGKGIDTLIAGFENQIGPYFGSLSLPQQYGQALNEAKKLFPLDTEYKTWMYLGLDRSEERRVGKERSATVSTK